MLVGVGHLGNAGLTLGNVRGAAPNEMLDIEFLGV